jgi:hypothetical protein
VIGPPRIPHAARSSALVPPPRNRLYFSPTIDIFDQIVAYDAGAPINVINTAVLPHRRNPV